MFKLVLNADIGSKFSYLNNSDEIRAVIFGMIYTITKIYADFKLVKFNLKSENIISELTVEAPTRSDLLNFKSIFINLLEHFLEEKYERKRSSTLKNLSAHEDFISVSFLLKEKTYRYTFVRKDAMEKAVLEERILKIG